MLAKSLFEDGKWYHKHLIDHPGMYNSQSKYFGKDIVSLQDKMFMYLIVFISDL